MQCTNVFEELNKDLSPPGDGAGAGVELWGTAEPDLGEGDNISPARWKNGHGDPVVIGPQVQGEVVRKACPTSTGGSRPPPRATDRGVDHSHAEGSHPLEELGEGEVPTRERLIPDTKAAPFSDAGSEATTSGDASTADSQAAIGPIPAAADVLAPPTPSPSNPVQGGDHRPEAPALQPSPDHPDDAQDAGSEAATSKTHRPLTPRPHTSRRRRLGPANAPTEQSRAREGPTP